MTLKSKFLAFFILISFAGILSTVESLLIQYRLNSEIDFPRVGFDLVLLTATLYFLWQRSTPGYILAIYYVLINFALSGYSIYRYTILLKSGVQLPINLPINLLVLTVTTSTLILFLLDYIVYRKKRDAM